MASNDFFDALDEAEADVNRKTVTVKEVKRSQSSHGKGSAAGTGKDSDDEGDEPLVVANMTPNDFFDALDKAEAKVDRKTLAAEWKNGVRREDSNDKDNDQPGVKGMTSNDFFNALDEAEAEVNGEVYVTDDEKYYKDELENDGTPEQNYGLVAQFRRWKKTRWEELLQDKQVVEQKAVGQTQAEQEFKLLLEKALLEDDPHFVEGKGFLFKEEAGLAATSAPAPPAPRSETALLSPPVRSETALLAPPVPRLPRPFTPVSPWRSEEEGREPEEFASLDTELRQQQALGALSDRKQVMEAQLGTAVADSADAAEPEREEGHRLSRHRVGVLQSLEAPHLNETRSRAVLRLAKENADLRAHLRGQRDRIAELTREVERLVAQLHAVTEQQAAQCEDTERLRQQLIEALARERNAGNEVWVLQRDLREVLAATTPVLPYADLICPEVPCAAAPMALHNVPEIVNLRWTLNAKAENEYHAGSTKISELICHPTSEVPTSGYPLRH